MKGKTKYAKGHLQTGCGSNDFEGESHFTEMQGSRVKLSP